MSNFEELQIPETLVAEEMEGFEAVRFWIGGGNDHVSLAIINPAEGEPSGYVWGKIAADIAKHAVLAMKAEDPSLSETELIANIERAFLERLAGTSKLIGRVSRPVQ